jgi:class 3 adenylate cyclase
VLTIGAWLASLGMSEYAARFVENRIDLSVLPELTDQDLEKLGVLMGDRRKMLRAIRDLGNVSAAVTPALTPAPAPPVVATSLAPAAAGAGERRYLTVMFCDLVGSTSIAAQLDAEEWRDLVGSYLDAASAAVIEMGGHVAKKLGDGLMTLFGYPVAQENDAERAARAALSIQRALVDLNRKNAATGKPELIARIGLETGPAVLDATGEIYGDVANIAARVQALAEPGAVLITARVQRQIAGLFVAEERGAHTLKGVPEPTALYRLVRASGGGRRAGQRNLTPLVGRDEEMAMLMRRWQRARQADGQLVMIVGEPGLGKSRLLEEFHTRLSDTPHTWVEWSGTVTGTWLWPKRKSEGLGSSSGRSRYPPILQRFASEGAERVAGNKMALNVERIVDGGVSRQEPLRRSGRFETLHLPLASSHRQMRIFGPIVLPQALLMASRQAQFRLGRSVGAQLIGDQRRRRKALFPEQFAHEVRGRPCVAAPLHQQVENFSLVVDRSPEPESSAADQDSHLVEMPLRRRPMTPAAKFPGEQRPELQHPSPDCLIRDIQPALGQQILDVTEAEGEAKVQPHRVPDDVRRELVASE